MSDLDKQEKETPPLSPNALPETSVEPVEAAVDPASRAALRMPSRSRLPPTVIGLGLVSLFTDMSSEMAYTQIPLFLTGVLGASGAAVGLIEGVAESTASLLRLVSGYWSDRSGRRKPLTVVGYSFGAISKPLLALANVWPLVLLLRFVDRFGKGLRTAPRDALITETTPRELRGRAFGLHRTMDTTGAVLGPLLGAWFLSRLPAAGSDPVLLGHNLRLLFIFAGLPGLCAVLTLLFVVKEPPRPQIFAPDGSRPACPSLPRWQELQPAYRHFLLITLLFNLGNFSDTFLILRARTLHFSVREVLFLYAAFNVVEAVLGYGAGILSDKVGRRPLIIAGYGVFAFVYLGFALAGNKATIWALFLTYGLYYTLTQGAQRAFAADMSDPHQRATQIGAYHTVIGLALLPASALAGILFDRNPALPFLVGAFTAALSALLLLLQFKKRIEPPTTLETQRHREKRQEK